MKHFESFEVQKDHKEYDHNLSSADGVEIKGKYLVCNSLGSCSRER
jgi:hypothetical protein